MPNFVINLCHSSRNISCVTEFSSCAAVQFGMARFALSTPRKIMTSRRKAVTAADIHDAIKMGRFRLYAQEIRKLKGDELPVRHYEVLLRMLDVDGGIVEPDAFIPLAESHNLMGDIDRWVIRTALRDFCSRAVSGLSFSLNLSANSLNDPSLWIFMRKELATSALSPGLVSFEITESAAISNFLAAKRLISQVRSAGCHVLLDDFGKGFNSFGSLRQLFPIDGIKIDGEFIRHAATNKVDRVIVESINMIGQRLGLTTVAEHVEDQRTLSIVHSLGIDQAQGFFVAQPQLFADILQA